MGVRNLTPVILDIITAPAVGMTYFFAETVVDTGQERVAGLLKITSVRSVESKNDHPFSSP